jgi:hypothetical protein
VSAHSLVSLSTWRCLLLGPADARARLRFTPRKMHLPPKSQQS